MVGSVSPVTRASARESATMTRVTTVRRAVAAMVGAVALLVAGASVASAHGGPGLIEFGEPEQTGPLEVTFPIRVTYQNDGHDAEGVEDVSLTGVGDDGSTFGPVDPLTPGDAPGVWIAVVELPSAGMWDLTLLIGEPESSGAILVEVAEVEEPGTDDGDAPDDTVEVEAGEPEESDQPELEATDDAQPEDGLDTVDDGATVDEDEGVPFLAILIGFLAAALFGSLAYRWMAGRRQPAASETSASAER